MKNKLMWTNYKIYAFILGIVIGTIIYNALGIDFSFSMIKKIRVNDFKSSFFYLMADNLRFWVVVFIISFLKIRNKAEGIIIFFQAFIMAGMISLSIISNNMILLYGVPASISKIFATVLMCDNKRPVLYRVLSLIIMLVSSMAENFFIINF